MASTFCNTSLSFLTSFLLTPSSVRIGAPSPLLAEVLSDPFTVMSAKRFVGVLDTTDLTRHFLKQGVKLPIVRLSFSIPPFFPSTLWLTSGNLSSPLPFDSVARKPSMQLEVTRTTKNTNTIPLFCLSFIHVVFPPCLDKREIHNRFFLSCPVLLHSLLVVSSPLHLPFLLLLSV